MSQRGFLIHLKTPSYMAYIPVIWWEDKIIGESYSKTSLMLMFVI